jgi:hypothetical protein
MSRIIDLHISSEVVTPLRLETLMEHKDQWGDGSIRMPVFETWRVHTSLSVVPGKFELVSSISPETEGRRSSRFAQDPGLRACRHRAGSRFPLKPMKRILTLALFLAFHCQSPAQVPRMTVRGNDGSVKLLQVEEAEVSVRILGDVAETVLDLNFRNDADRAVEGEFVLPLPEGATVSGYALEVNGRMRDGVSVERERARTAYETVKRRLIDPGIVERDAGNVYRTNVYPVPAKGTKRLRISYNETLRSDGKGFTYSLPLDFPDSLNSFSCELRGGGIQVSDAAGLTFTASADESLKAEVRNGRPGGILKLAIQSPEGPQMIVENGSQPAFFLSARPPELAPRPRPSPASVMLVWDASASGVARDHLKEFALLDAWFAKLGKTRVKLRILRDRLTDGGEFEIHDGRWPELRQTLEQVDYDGATDLSRIQVSAGQADLLVLVGDGLSTLGSKPPAIAVPWFFIHSGANPPPKSLVRSADASGGAAIPLVTDDMDLCVSKLTVQALRLFAVVGDDLGEVLIDQSPGQGQPLRVFGTLKESRAGKLELRYAFGNDIISTREVIYQPGGSPAGVVRRLHAQRVLADLESQDRPDRKRIIAHCKQHGLVSDFTSLIVLERIEDYAEHQIPPPEPELQEEYRRLVEARERSLGRPWRACPSLVHQTCVVWPEFSRIRGADPAAPPAGGDLEKSGRFPVHPGAA